MELKDTSVETSSGSAKWILPAIAAALAVSMGFNFYQSSRLDTVTQQNQTVTKKVDLVPLREVETLTGYIRGGVTVLGAKHVYPVYADEWIEVCDLIAVSAGVRGTQLLLSPADYLRAVSARVEPLSRKKG